MRVTTATVVSVASPPSRRVLIAILALVLLATGCASNLIEGDSALARALRDEADRDEPLAGVAGLEKRQFLFVGGFLNELIPGYFDDQVFVTRRDLGAETTTLFPSSASDVPHDAERIRAEALTLFARSGKPVLLAGHSKGGAAVLLVAIRWPELLLSGKVDRVIAIQGAIGGSPVADSLAGSGPVRALHARFRGLESLTTASSKALFASALGALEEKLSKADLARLSSRVFYVRSFEEKGDVAAELAVTHDYLRGFGSGRSDGLLLEEDMKLDGFGVDLGVLRCDHAGLTVSGVLSNTSARERRAFTRALFREVVSR